MHATDASLNGVDGRRLLSSYRHLLGQLMMARELTREQWGEVGMGMDVADRAERELGMVESVLRDFRSNEPTKRLMRVLQNISAVRIQRTWRAKEARIATVPLCMRKYMLIRAGELGVSNVAHIRTMSAGVITTASGGVGAGGKPLPLRGSVAWVHGRIEQMYVNKMAGDLSNDARHLPRRAFSEHIYDMYLSKYGVRVVAESELRDVFSAVRDHVGSSLRARTFALFLGMGHAGKGAGKGGGVDGEAGESKGGFGVDPNSPAEVQQAAQTLSDMSPDDRNRFLEAHGRPRILNVYVFI